MAEELITLEPDKIYHIYNHAIGKDNLFDGDDDYNWFLGKTKKYLLPVSDLLGYCLMPNHFHLAVRIKNEADLKIVFNKNKKGNLSIDELIKWNENYLSYALSRQYSNLFNAYAKYYNNFKNRQGTLFKRAFRRKLVEGDDYLQQLICYMHQNPVNAGFCKNPDDWKYSSYNDITGSGQTMVCREDVIELFDDLANFNYCNSRKVNLAME